MTTYRIYFKDGRVVKVKAEKLHFTSSGIGHLYNAANARAPIYINHSEIIAIVSEEALVGEEIPKPS